MTFEKCLSISDMFMNTHLLKPSHLDTEYPTHLSIPLDGLASLVEDGDVVRRVVVAKEHRHLDLAPELWPGKKKRSKIIS